MPGGEQIQVSNHSIPAPIDTEEAVLALRRLVVFGADQTGAYRELSGSISSVLGPDVDTTLAQTLRSWADAATPGVIILTGNAGTGKTAAAQAYCRAVGADLPATDDLVRLPGGQWLAKDVSGMASRQARAEAFQESLARSALSQTLLCANEGVLRDASEDLATSHSNLGVLMDEALRRGTSTDGGLRIVDVNRQRLTSPPLWSQLIDYVSRVELWGGCEGCPATDTSGVRSEASCPMRSNAEALRQPEVRSLLRQLVQIASGEVVPTIRELLALLAWAIVGSAEEVTGVATGLTCGVVREQNRDRGASAFTATVAYYNLLLGDGLAPEVRERSPLLSAVERLGVGRVADLEVDDWLRDTGAASSDIRRLAGRPSQEEIDHGVLEGSRSHLDRIRTTVGEMTYHRLGEVVSISEDPEMVRAGTKALVASDLPAQRTWRRRIAFEGSSALGGPEASLRRLSVLPFAPDLLNLATRVANGTDVFTDIRSIVRGLNFLVAGYCDAAEGLIVPEPASLFARNPGSFRNARPAFVHNTIDNERIGLVPRDDQQLGNVLDVDHVEVRLLVDNDLSLGLLITPRLYQAIREAEGFQGPVGQGATEMTDLRGFYGRLAAGVQRESGLHVADPSKSAIVRIQLPHFPSHA